MLVTRQVHTVINYQKDWKWHCQCQVISQKICRKEELINHEHDLIYIMVFYAHWDKINWPPLRKVPCYHGLWRCLCVIAPIKIVLFFFQFSEELYSVYALGLVFQDNILTDQHKFTLRNMICFSAKRGEGFGTWQARRGLSSHSF